MVQVMRRSLILLACGACGLWGQRVVMVSLDGLGYQTLTGSPVAEELTVLKESARRGAMAQGMRPSFPASTAISHASLWTGVYGDVNHITANNQPVLPRSEHTVEERIIGFQATQLAADTIWVTAARAGISSLAHQPTQGYPFMAHNTAPGAAVVNGYQTRSFSKHAVYTAKDTESAGDGAMRLKHGDVSLLLKRVNGGLEISVEGKPAKVLARAHGRETEEPRTRALARYFSEGLDVEQPTRAQLYFRLFSLREDDFRLYVTPLQELALSGVPEGTEAALYAEAGGFVGNGPHALLQSGALSQAEYLEAVELVIRQLTRHATWLTARLKPRFVQSYLPFPDEFDHEWIGQPENAAWRRWGYVAVNRGAAEFAKLAGEKDHLLWVSDHGMTVIRKTVAIGKVLKDAGLADRVSYVQHSVLVNTTEWKDGTVPMAERDAVVEQVRKALSTVLDNRLPVITEFFTPENDRELLGIGGPAGSDLYFDFAPGYRGIASDRGEVVRTLKAPEGSHGFLPVREDMESICILRGPRVTAGTKWPRLRSIQMAPLVSDLLGIAPPEAAKAESPLGPRKPE
jgi:hypothetical protein